MPDKAGVKYKIGILFIFLSITCPLLGLIVPFLGLSGGVATFIVGITLMGLPEVFLIIGVALSGKQAISMVRSKLLSPAGKTRYITGIYMFSLGFFGGLIVSFIEYIGLLHLKINTLLIISASFDLFSLAGALLAGVEFFEKIKSIYRYEGD